MVDAGRTGDALLTSTGTVIDALLVSLRAASQYDKNDQAPPAVVLWPDKDQQWCPLLPRLRLVLPQLLTFGDYDPATKTGPAIWLRPMVARALPEADWPEGAVPILYLPGVSRNDLRAVEQCPAALQPLAELQYRGVFWNIKSKDWTLTTFLTSASDGLGLELAGDAATASALADALEELADHAVADLRGTRLDADFFRELLIPDIERELLRWLDNPEGTRRAWGDNRWHAFRDKARASYGFDPDKDGQVIGAERLGESKQAWDRVWKRFAEAPRRYPGLKSLLRRAKPVTSQASLYKTQHWPQDNETDENSLREALINLGTGTAAEGRQRLRELDEYHGTRRGSVWAGYGEAPLAFAIAHLAKLAALPSAALSAASLEGMAEAYAGGGWRADGAAIDAMAAVEKPADVEAVRNSIRAVYKPWLEEAAEWFQQLAATHPLPRKPPSSAVPNGVPGCCVLFADGLRFDVGQKLVAALTSLGLKAEGSWRFSTLPSVTPTAKPAASPIAPLFGPPGAAADFLPSVLGGSHAGKTLTIDIFRKLLEEHGYQVLQGESVGTPSEGSMAWCEYGHLDRLGHDEQWKLAKRVDEEVRGLTQRIQDLLDAGWRQVRVVTDHGWLLLPGGLPKQELPSFLTESRWGRCATLKPNVDVHGAVGDWYWSDAISIAVPGGIACYKAGSDYAHGGLSVQECVVPVLTISSGAPAQPTVTIQSVKWRGLRCQVQVTHGGASLSCDLRTSANVPGSSLAESVKTISESGAASLALKNDTDEGVQAVVVVLSGNGEVLASFKTTAGGGE
jgi:hypothetical protein